MFFLYIENFNLLCHDPRHGGYGPFLKRLIETKDMIITSPSGLPP